METLVEGDLAERGDKAMSPSASALILPGSRRGVSDLDDEYDRSTVHAQEHTYATMIRCTHAYTYA